MTVPMATAQLEPMSVEEWASLPEDEERELVDGYLVEAEVATFAHGYLVSELTARLREYFRPRGGWVVGDGVRLALPSREA